MTLQTSSFVSVPNAKYVPSGDHATGETDEIRLRYVKRVVPVVASLMYTPSSFAEATHFPSGDHHATASRLLWLRFGSKGVLLAGSGRE